MRIAQKNSSIEKAFAILSVFSQNGGRFELGVGEISKILKMHKSTVHRFLRSMEKVGVIERNNETGKYRLGLKLYELGNSVSLKKIMVDRARKYLEDLHWYLNETVHFATLKNGEVVYLDKIIADRNFVIISEVGKRLPAHCTGLGKAMLAFLPESDVKRIIKEKGLKKFTKNTITNKKDLFEELKKIRECGYAIDNEEIEDGLRCIAAPIFNGDGEVIAAVSISGPSSRINETTYEEYSKHVIKTARLISEELKNVNWRLI
ncbi:transcriptional regulator, IclR family [Candidatus Kryptonium thompsonii]|uniref:Transcriptional regulator, IclR family n=1 Tax=Candidatus Kryptonium thompsonii TaxID=1633631 RepID=A0A0P1MH73_9BACT|nr:IclR family transcriptional regulator [Candidatus Kryptonium thompsoni]CUS80758.1 transcriptional regulator, IclR family [Candidatus Kryptonium thompsoni]CUS83867.1 transcriptional regulator, IclR family [Candidatus Kryptonium thompsoni]CUS85170.1 transcriptional regulator, IclR family [Candidatus Kryptonium thompsoni]CUS93853.1 transcriptional regulator, IclR family [Candidatus Kryptonium thompsoni]CUS99380.1 transcriptional regulator, IclR family [Candidatus Kryptonium thompsoni]